MIKKQHLFTSTTSGAKLMLTPDALQAMVDFMKAHNGSQWLRKPNNNPRSGMGLKK